MTRPLNTLLICMALVVGLVTGCGSGLPAVLSSTPDQVSVEFSEDDNLTKTRKLALEECAKHDLIPEFEVVEKTATKKSRVAKYRCVSPNVAAAPAPAPAATPAATPVATPTEETTSATETEPAEAAAGAQDAGASEAATE
jgi:hypothetical protein